MADDADQAQALDEMRLKTSLYRSRKDEPQAEAIGVCLYCEEPITEAGRRWCNAECRDGWESENR